MVDFERHGSEVKCVPQTVKANYVVMWAKGDMVKPVMVEKVIWTKAVGDAVSIMDRTARAGNKKESSTCVSVSA